MKFRGTYGYGLETPLPDGAPGLGEQRKAWRECVELRAEIARLHEERKELLGVVAAAALLIRELDADTFESLETAELLYELLLQLPPPMREEAPYWWPQSQ